MFQKMNISLNSLKVEHIRYPEWERRALGLISFFITEDRHFFLFLIFNLIFIC